MTVKINSAPVFHIDAPTLEAPIGGVFSNIFSRLFVWELGSCPSVCSKWNNLLKDEKFCRLLIERNYPNYNLEGIEEFRKVYMKLHTATSNIRNGIFSSHLLGGYRVGSVNFLCLNEGEEELFSLAERDHFEKVRIWDVESEQCIDSINPGPEHGTCMAVVDKLIFLGGEGPGGTGTIKIYDRKAKKWKEILEGHEKKVTALKVVEVEFGPGNKKKMLVSGSQNGEIGVWDLNSLKNCIFVKNHSEEIKSFAFAENALFSGSFDQTISAMDMKSFVRLHTFKGHSDGVCSLATNKQLLFSGSWDKSIRVWNAHTGEHISSLEGHTNAVHSLLVVNDVLISCSADKTIKIWDACSFKGLATLHDQVNSFTTMVMRNGKLYSNVSLSKIQVWDFEASHKAALKEIAQQFENENPEINKEAERKFSRQLVETKDQICRPSYDSKNSSVIEHFEWANCTRWHKAKLIERYLEKHVKS